MHLFNRPAALICMALAATAAHAAEAAFDFNIPAQPLSQVLDALARQTGLQPVYADHLVQGVDSPGVQGHYTLQDAVAKALTGTKLTFQFTAEKIVAIKPGRIANKTTAEPTELDPVVVTATRTERRADEVPASVSVITAKDIASLHAVVVSDTLRNIEGVDVAGNASLGASEGVILRGVGSSFAGTTSQVLLDGLPLESPMAGIHFGMKAVALDDFERIEVVRGPVSALYGSGAIGGVVNMIPKRWRGKPGADVKIGAGSHNATLAAAAVGSASDVIDFRLSVSDYRTDGYVAQPLPDPWGTMDLAPRDGKDRKVGLTAGLRPADNQEITLAVHHADIQSAWFGGHPNYRMNDKVESYDLGYRFEAGDWGVFKISYQNARQKAHILFDDEAINGNPGSLILAEVDDRVDASQHFNVQADIQTNAANLLTLGYVHGVGTYSSRWEDTIFGGASQSIWNSRLNGVFVQDEYGVSDAFTLLAGGRWDRYEFFGDTKDGVRIGNDTADSVFNPRIGARYHFSNATSLYATAGTAYLPALNSLKFGGGRGLDNPGLKPETSTSYEVGVNHRQGSWSGRAAIFHTNYKDKITSMMVGGKSQYQNIGRVAVDGFELAIEGATGAWRPYFNYSYTDSRIKANPGDLLTVGKHVQRVSPNKLNLGLTYAPSASYYAKLSGRYVGPLYFNDRNTAIARNSGHFVSDAQIGWRLPAGGIVHEAELTLAVNNLFDKSYKEQQFEYMDRRNFWLGLSARF